MTHQVLGNRTSKNKIPLHSLSLLLFSCHVEEQGEIQINQLDENITAVERISLNIQCQYQQNVN